MNEYNEDGERHGYWDTTYDTYRHIGNYFNGIETGTWYTLRMSRLDKNLFLVSNKKFFNTGDQMFFFRDRVDNNYVIYYYDFESGEQHCEESF